MALTNVDIQLLAGLNINSSEAEIIKAIKIIQKNLHSNKQAELKLNTNLDTNAIQSALGKLEQMLNRADLSLNTKDSINGIQKEAIAMIDVAKSANKASQEKVDFAKANKHVERSAEDTAEAINREHQAMENLDDLNYILRNVNASGNAGNSVFQSFGNTLDQAFRTYTTANILTDAIRKTVNAGKEAVETVKELNDEATSLRMATGGESSYVDDLMDSYNELGQELGAITSSVSQSADEWLRQGHSIEDTNKLIRDSMILSKVSNLDSAEATKYLTSAYQGYKVAVKDVIGIVDKLSAVDLESATDAGGLAEAMSRTAQGAEIAGISMDRLLGMIATTGEVTQKSMSSIGETFKTLFSRMRNIKDGNLSLIGENGEIEDLSNVEIVLEGVGIKLRESNMEFRNFQDVLDDVAESWDSYSSVQQAAIAKSFSGVRNQENFLVMMENWDKVVEYTNVSANSAGTSTEKFGYYLESLEAKTNSLKASLEALATTTISDELYASVLDTSKEIVDLTTETGILKGLLAGVGTAGSIYTFQQLTHYLHDAAQGFSNLNEAMSMTRSGAVGINDMQKLIDLTGGLSQSQIKLLLSTNNLTDAQKIAILINQGMSKAQAQAFITTNNLSTAQQGATTATITLSGVIRGLWTTLLANPLVLVTMAVTAGVTAFNTYKNKMEEVRQATSNAATAYKESAKSIDDYISRYQELQQALQDTKGDEEATATVKQQLLDLQTELNSKFGEEAKAINLVTGEYEKQIEAIRSLNEEEANKFQNENRKGISAATKKMEKDKTYSLSYGTVSAYTDEGKALQDIASSYADKGMVVNTDESTGMMTVTLTADAQTAYDTINDFETDLRNKAKDLGNEKLFDSVFTVSSDALNNAKSVVDKYGEIYNQALMAELVTNKPISAVYNKALNAVEAYNQAVSESENPYNDSKVAEAKQNLDEVKAEINGNLAEWDKYSSITGDLFAQANTSLLDFNERLSTDTSMQSWANQLKGLTQTELLSMSDDDIDDAFDSLIESAKEYGLSINDVIDALVRLGYIQGNVTTASDALTYNIVDLDNLNNQIDSIQSSYKGLTSACEEYNQHGYITADTLQTLLNLDGQYLACLMNENGQLMINGQTYQALVQAKLADAEATAVQQAIEELGTVTTQQQIQADTTAIGVMAQKGTALATLTGQYASLANVAVSAAQAQALADAYTDASSKNQEEADRIMSNLNAKLTLIQNTATSTAGSFRVMTNHLNGFTDSSGKAKSATDELTESMKKQKSALESTKSELEKQKQYYEDVASAIDWFYDKQISKQEKAIKNLEKEIKLIEAQIDIYDGALSAIDNFYEKQIEALEKKKESLAGNNKEVEAAINLEKRQQELLEARNKKSVGVYEKGKGIVYTTSSSAIKEAEENLANAQREKEEASIDAQIEKLREYQSLWAEIPSAKAKAEQESQMISLLGANWESILMEGRIQNITAFKDKYIGLQQQIDNNESMIASYEEKIAYYESLKNEWDNLLNKYTEDTYTQLLIGAFGNEFENELLNGRTGRWTQFADDYYNIQVQLKEVTDQIEALAARMESYAARIESAANSAVKAVEKLKDAEVNVSSSKGWYTGGWTSAISGRAKGGIITKNDEGDLDFVAKSVGEDHMVALTEGEAVIPKETVDKNPEVVQKLITGEDITVPAYETEEITREVLTKDGIKIIPITEFYKDMNPSQLKLMRKLDELSSVDLQLGLQPKNIIPKFAQNFSNINKSTKQNVEINVGDIHVHNVQNADQFAKEMKRKLSGIVSQEISRRDM